MALSNDATPGTPQQPPNQPVDIEANISPDAGTSYNYFDGDASASTLTYSQLSGFVWWEKALDYGWTDEGLRASDFLHGVRPPTSIDFSIQGPQEQFRQGGFFVPIKTLDELDSTWQFQWDQLTQTELDALEAAARRRNLAVGVPLGYPITGYFEAVESQGIKGKVDKDTGEALFSCTAEFQVLTMGLSAYMKPLPDSGQAAVGKELGVPVDGVPLATVQGPSGSVLTFTGGYGLFEGGVVDPWGDVNAPEGDGWDRPTRTLTGTASGDAPESAGIQMDNRHVPPSRGSVFVAFRSADPSLDPPS